VSDTPADEFFQQARPKPGMDVISRIDDLAGNFVLGQDRTIIANWCTDSKTLSFGFLCGLGGLCAKHRFFAS
jgi:hypothetical protein